MSDSTVYFNGNLMGASGVCLELDDAGFERGEGVFETLRVEGGAALEVADHVARLQHGLARLELSIPEDTAQLSEAVRAVAAAAARPLARLRITVTGGSRHAGPTRLIRAVAYSPPARSDYDEGVSVVSVSGARIDTTSPLCGLKSLSYGLYAAAAREARAAGATEGLLSNERGELAEATRSNVIVISEGRALTPGRSSGCLPGIVRELLLQAGLLQEETIQLEQLGAVDGMALTNSLVGLLPVARLDGRNLAANAELRHLRGELRQLRR